MTLALLRLRGVLQMTDARKEDYWERVEQDPETVADLLLAESDEWTIHGISLVGEQSERDLLHLLVVRSRLGESGLLLSVGYCSVDRSTAEVRWSGDNNCIMRVSGPVTKALLQMLGRADAEGLAGEQQDPLLIDALDRADPERDPERLTTPLVRSTKTVEAQREAQSDRMADKSMKDSEQRCQRCGAVREKSEMDSFSGELGDVWVCSDQEACE